MLKIASYSLALLSLLALSGCGSSGDGGDGASSTTPDLVVGDTELLGPVSGAQLPAGSGIGSGTAPNTRSDVSDTEYLRNDVYDSVRLYKALQWGIKGAGVKIAVLDSGIDADHPDIASNLDTVNSGSAIGSVTFGSDYEDNDGHGTNSAGSAVGNDNGSGIQGAAPEATLIAIKVTDTGSLSEANQIRGMDMARTAGADIVNISFGLSGFENESLEDALDSGAMTQDLIDAYKRGISDDIIYTLAAGNSGNANPEWDGKLAGYGASGGHLLVVGSLNDDGDDIASFSNRAGDAKNYFILAPGQNLVLPNEDGTHIRTSGTSFAAPFVAGAAALVKSAGPPTLSGKDVVEILLSTTDDMGVAGIDEIYGAGRLNIERALSPVGSATVASASSVDGPRTDLASLNVSTYGLVGQNISQANALRNVLFFDKYNRAYSTDVRASSKSATDVSTPDAWLSNKTYSNQLNVGETTQLALTYSQKTTGVARASQAFDDTQLRLTNKLSDTTTTELILGSDWATGFKQAGFEGFRDLTQTSFYGLSNQGVGASIASDLTDKTKLEFKAGVGKNVNSDFDGQQQLAVASLSHKLTNKSLISLDFGLSRENRQLMGTELGAGFSSNQNVDTRFVTLALQRQIRKNIDLGMSYSFGKTGSFTSDSLVKNFTGGKLDAAELWLAYQGKNQTFKAGLSRELGYRSGSLALSIPTSVTYEGEVGTVHFDEQNIGLKSATVYGAALSYGRDLGKYGFLEIMGKLKASQTGDGATGFSGSSVDAGLKYKLKF